MIPASRLSQPALKLLSYLPLPNISGVGATEPNYSASGHDIYNGNIFNVRIDHYASERLRLFGRLHSLSS